MIVHVFAEEKFILFASFQFDKVESRGNRYFVKNEKNFYECLIFNNKIVNRKNSSINSLFELNKFSAGVLYFLNEETSKVILSSPLNMVWVWNVFGGDAYPYIVSDQKIFQKNISIEVLIFKLFNTNLLKIFIYDFFVAKRRFKKKIVENNWYKSVLERIDFYSTVLPQEAPLFQKNLPLKNASYLNFTFGSIKSLLGNFETTSITANNILIGNSSDPTNRHDIIFDLISNLDLGDRKVISPLSYGYEKYKDYIVKYGNEKFGGNFEPIIDFLKLDEYISKISSCSICIMNHYRQQAIGNLIILLWLGAKVYVNSDSLAFDYFTSMNIKVFSIQDEIVKNPISIFSPMKIEDIKSNKMIIEMLYADEKVIGETQNLVNIILSFQK